MSASPLNLDEQICFSLYRASNAVIRRYRPLLDELGLTYLQYLVLLVLWEQDGISVKQLGRRLHLDSGTLTPLLKRLELKALIERRIDPEDERAKKLVLSSEGKALKGRAEEIPHKMLCHIDMPIEQLQALKQQCDLLIKKVVSEP